MSNASEIREKVAQLSGDIDLLRRVVHGSDTETVPLGTPPTPTSSLRKMVKDITEHEITAAEEVIAGATERINAEGAAQEARVQTAGNVQTARVNEAGDTQFGRVTAEGNAQFARVNTEGNAQYARVNEAGTAQTAQVNAAGQTQHAAVTDKGNALLADINEQGAERKAEINATGAAFLLQISSNGDVQNTRLTTTGAAEDAKLRATGDAQRLIVILEGDTQAQRLAENGDVLNATLLELVRAAAQSAKEAEESAGKAVDMTGVGPAGKGKFGFVRIGSGINVTEEGEISVVFPAVVSTPAVTFPPVVGIGYEYELSVSAESAVYGANIATFIIAMDEDYVREIPAVGNAATHRLPISGVHGSTGRIVVTAVDDLGNMSLDSVISFQRNAVSIATPRVLSPVDAATDVSLAPRITVQALQVSGVPFTPEATQLQISTLEDFSVCAVDTGEEGAYETQHQLDTDLQKKTVYHVRVRHRAALYGWSAWSAASMFETMDCYVDVPVIYSPLGDVTDVALRPAISLSAFTNVGPADTPSATQVQIARDENFTDIVAQHNGGYMTTFTPAEELALITVYYVRARHRGARWDWSGWSKTTRFTTLNAYTQPVALTYPANGAAGVPLLPTLRLPDFANVGPVDTAAGTHIQIARDAGFANVLAEYNGAYTVAWTLTTMLTKLTGYFARARHKGTRWGWGEWGTMTAFTAEDAFVRVPSVTAPVNGATGVALRPAIAFSAFANAGPADIVAGTHFQLARDAAFTDIIHDSGEAGGYVTSWTPGGNLALNSAHYVRVRHKGKLWGWSGWSATVGFSTLNAYVNAPTVTAPANNATGVALRPTITLSGFSNVGPADVGSGTQIQIALDAGFTNVVASYASGYAVSWTPGNNLGINTTYYVRARHCGAVWGWSAWSAAVKFTIMNIYVNPPQMIAPANGATGVSLTPLLQMTAPSAVNQEATGTTFHLATNPEFTGHQDLGPWNNSGQIQVATPLAINTLYYVKPWTMGAITGWREGPVTTFRTLNGWVNTPSITNPVAGAIANGDSLYITSSAFATSHAADTHIASQWHIRDVTNNAIIYDSGIVSGDKLTAIRISLSNFVDGRQYRILTRHKGQTLGWSDRGTDANPGPQMWGYVDITLASKKALVWVTGLEISEGLVCTATKIELLRSDYRFGTITKADHPWVSFRNSTGSWFGQKLFAEQLFTKEGQYTGSHWAIWNNVGFLAAVGNTAITVVEYNPYSVKMFGAIDHANGIILQKQNIAVILANNGSVYHLNMDTRQVTFIRVFETFEHVTRGFFDRKNGRFVVFDDTMTKVSQSYDGWNWTPITIPSGSRGLFGNIGMIGRYSVPYKYGVLMTYDGIFTLDGFNYTRFVLENSGLADSLPKGITLNGLIYVMNGWFIMPEDSADELYVGCVYINSSTRPYTMFARVAIVPLNFLLNYSAPITPIRLFDSELFRGTASGSTMRFINAQYLY